MTSSGQQRSRHVRGDLGLRTVERAYEAMSIDEQWSVREERGFTWWGHWIRERIWAEEAVRSGGETLWHVRARTPAYRGVPDEPATYVLVNDMNRIAALSAFAYDPEDGTVSARCGAFIYREVAEWLQAYLLTAAALQASLAWWQVPAQADGRTLDDEAHPASGPRSDPDDMLNAAGSIVPAPCPFTPRVLKRAARELASDGLVTDYWDDGKALNAMLPISDERGTFWTLRPIEHPVLGPGAVAWLFVPPATGPRRAAWIANALNLAESADWTGEIRPHALGAWRADGGALNHIAFLPSALLGRLKADAALLLVRSLLAWGAIRARFIGERLPWLETAAAARYPDDEPPPEGEPPSEGSEEDGELDAGSGQGASEEPAVPISRQGFGPAARVPRPRAQTTKPRAHREVVVDPTDKAAYPEIDAAVTVAEDGDTILVRPGTYRTPVVVDRAVRIEGQGPREAILLEPVGGEALGFAASGATVRGLTIRPARAGNDGADWSAVAFHDAAGSVEDCDLSTHLGATIWVGGPSTRAVIRDCTIVDGAQNPIWVIEEARAEVLGCRISGHRWPAIAGGEHATLTVRDSEIVDNLDHGIVAADRATLVVEGCTIARNAVSGVLLLSAAPASRVAGNTIEENGGAGVFVEGGRGRIVGNRIRHNDVGIGVMDGSTPTIEDNALDEDRCGLGIRGAGADPRVSANSVSGCREWGIAVEDSAGGRFEANAVGGCGGPGVRVTDQDTAPRFSGNHVTGCAVGIFLGQGAGGEFRSNDLRGNTGGSWQLDAPGPLTRADNLEDTGIAKMGPAAPPPPGAPGGTAPPTRLN